MKEINNNITEEFCSFEVSKLLKEKEFDPVNKPENKYGYREGYSIKLFHVYEINPEGVIRFGIVQNNSTSFNDLLYDYTKEGNEYGHHNYIAPTHALAIEWLRVNFGIWITCSPVINTWCNSISYLKDNKMTNSTTLDYFETPQEATEAALLYVLKNLI